MNYNLLSRWLLKIIYKFCRQNKLSYSWFENAIEYITKDIRVLNIKLAVFAGIHINSSPMPEDFYGYKPMEILAEPKLLGNSLSIISYGIDPYINSVKLKGSDMTVVIRFGTATHIDKDHIHNHFILNTVNYETSYKWQQNPKDLQRLKDYSDELCRQYGLMVIPSMDKSNYTKAGEYRITKRGMSWKYELYLAVNECIRNSTSKEEFISHMEKLGYKVKWTDTRKYITFTTPSGKRCRNNKLYKADELTKEKIENRLQLNARYADKRGLQQRMNNVLNAVALLLSPKSNNQKNSKNHKNYPLSKLEGDALIERIAELKKGRGLDWDNQYNNNYEQEW